MTKTVLLVAGIVALAWATGATVCKADGEAYVNPDDVIHFAYISGFEATSKYHEIFHNRCIEFLARATEKDPGLLPTLAVGYSTCMAKYWKAQADHFVNLMTAEEGI